MIIMKNKINIFAKTYFITGLAVVIPLWLTFFVVTIIFNWVSNFTLPIVNYFIADMFLVHITGKILSFFISIISIIALGFIANRVFGKNILNLIGKLIEKLPILGTVYSSSKQFVNFVFCKDSTKKFKKVVFIPYPNKEIYSVAFLTSEQIINDKKYVCAFMPTTPNPTTGFLLLVREEEIIYTNYTIEQAFQFIISIGVIDMVDVVVTKK